MYNQLGDKYRRLIDTHKNSNTHIIYACEQQYSWEDTHIKVAYYNVAHQLGDGFRPPTPAI